MLGFLLLLDGLFVAIVGELGIPGFEFLKSILVYGIVLMLLGVAYLAVGVGISWVRPWARRFGIATYTVTIIITIIEFGLSALTHSSSISALVFSWEMVYYLIRPYGLVVPLVMIYFLTRPGAKSYFG